MNNSFGINPKKNDRHSWPNQTILHFSDITFFEFYVYFQQGRGGGNKSFQNQSPQQQRNYQQQGNSYQQQGNNYQQNKSYNNSNRSGNSRVQGAWSQIFEIGILYINI